jgi:peptidoglycan hydrolase-like protein with peptidoglycan-binding domain
MELTTKIIIGAVVLGGTAVVLWPSSASAATKPPPAGATLDLSQVRDVQRGLIAVGYSVGSAGADGWFGVDTAAAVRKFMGGSSGQITNTFRSKLATALRAKGYNVSNETGPTLDKTTGPTHGGVAVTGGMGALMGKAWSALTGAVTGAAKTAGQAGGALVGRCACMQPYDAGPALLAGQKAGMRRAAGRG